MKSGLLARVTDRQKTELKKSWEETGLIRKALREHLEAKLQSERNSAEDIKSFDSGAWSCEQANRLGYIRAMKEVISIFSD